MAKTLTGKRIVFELEFYWRGKTRKPSVSFTFAGDNYDGLPEKILDSEEYKKFDQAAHDLCEVLVEAGELD